ncbi:MAG: UDP-N-acetylmuramoyl-L-alanine--D-glutamate ligase [Legionellales bacterium]|nr:UDP-N-acetylmuramoyl-L-alanine--D-glutamate ligase [Legionellales bacterium]
MHLVAGLGKTGHSIARYLQRRNKPFAVFDTRSQPAGLLEFQAKYPEHKVFLGEIPEALYGEITEIITSPGVALDGPVLRKAIERGIPVIGDIECFAREVKAPVIAITGTNGKSTVTTLVWEMAKASGIKVAVAGNIGLPVLDVLDDGVPYDLWVLELSSFQLEVTSSLAPLAATLLNVTSDHLDRHHHLEAYLQAKRRVYHLAKTCLYQREDHQTLPPEDASSNWVSFGLDAPGKGDWGLVIQRGVSYLAYGSERFQTVDSLRIKGRHNWQNALAACALAELAGIPRCHMIRVLENFPGLPHRSQWVRTHEGVDYIDDSKGTNIGATVSAISGIGAAMQGKIVLIAGGQGKGADFRELRAPLASFVRSVVLMGEDAGKLEHALADVLPVVHAPSLAAAVTLAKAHALPNDVVLLSPACASLDMFRDFNERGEVFTRAVNSL